METPGFKRAQKCVLLAYNPPMNRRHFMALLGAGAATALAQPHKHSRFKQCAMMVNFPQHDAGSRPAPSRARLGCAGFDLIPPEDWPTLKKYGLIPTLYHDIANTFEDGIIHTEVHDSLEKIEHAAIERAAAAGGCPTVIVVGGQKRGMAVEQGMDNAVKFLNRIKAHAEDKNVNIVMEPVNPVDRPDQILNRLGLAPSFVSG